MNKEFFEDQKVWCINAWGTIDECTILDYIDLHGSNNSYYKVQLIDGGWYNALSGDIFKSYGEALKEKLRRSINKKNNYKSEINNLKELFSFMLCHMQSCQDNTDYDACVAAKEKFLELTGIDLNNN